MRNLSFALLACLSVAACNQTPEAIADQAKKDEATCAGFGAKRGTDAMVNCRMALVRQRDIDMQQRADALLTGLALLSASSTPVPVMAAPVRCQTFPNGIYGGSQTTCF